MAKRVLLHVGLMKSGTTFIQGRLNANRAVLAEQGILIPGPSWRRTSQAVRDLMGSGGQPGAWMSLRDEIETHPGTAIVSMEYLGPLGQGKIATVAEDFSSSEIQVLLTVRDLGRVVPAMWQEAIKNRRTWSWPDYLESVRHGGEAGSRFWRQQGAPRIVERWAAAVGMDCVTVVTVPPPGTPPELLWDRFCDVADIAASTWAEAPRANESLGVASVELMASLNAQTGDLGRRAYKKKVKALAKHLLVHHKSEERSIGFTVPRWLHRRAESMTDRLASSGVHVVGSLGELAPVDVPGVDPSAVTPEETRDAAVHALASVLRAGPAITPKVARRARRG